MRIIITKYIIKTGDDMDYNKIFTDFEKRYGKKCEEAYFVGKPIVFFSRPGMTVGCSTSIGGCIALLRRDDDRVEVQFSDSTEFLSCNRLDFEYNKEKEIIKLLLDVEKYGVEVGGAKIFMFYNTALSQPVQPMFFSALGGFCKKVPPPQEIAKHFDELEKNMICLSSKKDHITIFDGQRIRYLPFPDSQVKIVISHIGEKEVIRKFPQDTLAKDGLDALARNDWEKLGNALNREAAHIAEKNNLKKVSRLLDVVKRLDDAYGSGVLEDGGIFSVVKNSRVDAFMYDFGAEYKRYFGGCPDFYVTRAEDSGVKVSKENDDS